MSDNPAHTGWGKVRCELDTPAKIEIGNLVVHLLRLPTDIATRFEYPHDVFWKSTDKWRHEWRTALEETRTDLRCEPVAPARNIVARPIRDLFIPPSQSLTVYVGYPAWLQIITSNNVVLADLATELMSETWLGPNTLQGEVAFATQTQARLSRDKLPQTSHTIRAPITIQNSSRDQLHITRLSIPAPELPTFRCDGQLWSAPVSIECEESLSEARIAISNTAPDFLDSAERVSDARVNDSRSSVRKAIGFLFG